jgi:hypothetical protein
VRRQLREGGIESVTLGSVPGIAHHVVPGQRFSRLVLRSTCLERALVEQRWRAARGERLDVVIGVKGTGPTFEAHAWVDGEPKSTRIGFAEIARHPASPDAEALESA